MVCTTLSVKEVAESLGVSLLTGYHIIHRGDIAAIRVGRQLKISKAEFEAYKKRNSTA